MIRKDGFDLEIKGLELSFEFYNSVGRPMLEKMFAEYMEKAAAGLVGEGSECFGFDDRISTDHDYGPSFCIWLPEKEHARIGEEMNKVYASLPGEFRGVRTQIQRAQGRRGILSIEQFYSKFLGKKGVPQTAVDWLVIPEHCLAVAANGMVFEDRLGEFSHIRRILQGYYPEDVRLKKIASRAVKMAHAGQCNYSRMMRRGDTVAALLALEEFIKASLSMVYLLNKRYAPYYKWMWRGLEGLKMPGDVRELLRFLAETGLKRECWQADTWDKYQHKLNMEDRIVMLVEEICALTAKEMRNQGISDETSDYLEPHAYAVMRHIQEENIRSLPILAF